MKVTFASNVLYFELTVVETTFPNRIGRLVQFFMIRSHLYFKPEFTSKGSKISKKIPSLSWN